MGWGNTSNHFLLVPKGIFIIRVIEVLVPLAKNVSIFVRNMRIFVRNMHIFLKDVGGVPTYILRWKECLKSLLEGPQRNI